jgi:hypothetical protein
MTPEANSLRVFRPVTDEDFERLLSAASERPKSVAALRHADDVWQSLVAPAVPEGERVAWRHLRASLAGALLQMWEPNGRTHDVEALRRVPPSQRNQLAADTYLLALGGLNLLTIAAAEFLVDEKAKRALTDALRGVGIAISDSLTALREKPPAWPEG